MNTNRTITWGIFVAIVGLIVWGMIAASQKTSKYNGPSLLTVEVSSSDWIRGGATAPSTATSSVTLVEYSDFQCPACASYFPLVERVTKEDPRIKFVYRNFPLPQHQNAIPAAKAAGAAGKQGKFWDMYEMIFSTHDEWENATNTESIFKGYAVKLGLDIAKYTADVDSKDVQDKIDSDVKSGEASGVDSTPTFYLNGKKIVNPQSYELFKKLINDDIQTKN